MASRASRPASYTYRIENTSKIWATGYDFPAVGKGMSSARPCRDGNIATAQGFVFNLRREKWQDPPGARRGADAVQLRMDERALFYDLYQRPASFWGGSDLAAEGMPGGEELALLEPLVGEGQAAPERSDRARGAGRPENDPSQNLPDGNLRRAGFACSGETGWVVGPRRTGCSETTAGPCELVIIQVSPAFDRIVNPYVENLRQIGIDAKLERIDNAQYVERRGRATGTSPNQLPDDLGIRAGDGLKQWFGFGDRGRQVFNLMALQSDPAVDTLIDQASRPRARRADARGARPRPGAARAPVLDSAMVEPGALGGLLDMYGRPETLPPLALGTLDFWWYDAEGAPSFRPPAR